MKMLIVSGDFREIIDVQTDDLRVAHRIGCLRAARSDKELGELIRTSAHLDGAIYDDDLFSAADAVAKFH